MMVLRYPPWSAAASQREYESFRMTVFIIQDRNPLLAFTTGYTRFQSDICNPSKFTAVSQNRFPHSSVRRQGEEILRQVLECDHSFSCRRLAAKEFPRCEFYQLRYMLHMPACCPHDDQTSMRLYLDWMGAITDLSRGFSICATTRSPPKCSLFFASYLTRSIASLTPGER